MYSGDKVAGGSTGTCLPTWSRSNGRTGAVAACIFFDVFIHFFFLLRCNIKEKNYIKVYYFFFYMTSKPAIAECFYKENGEYMVKRKYIINTKENPYYSIPPWGDQRPLFQANNPFLSSSFLVKFDKQNDLRDEANRTYH